MKSRIYRRLAVHHRRRIRKVLLGLLRFTETHMENAAKIEEFDAVDRRGVPRPAVNDR